MALHGRTIGRPAGWVPAFAGTYGRLDLNGFDVSSMGTGPPDKGTNLAKAPKPRLDELLVDQGLLADLKTAQGWVMAGKVVVDGKVVSTPGSRFAETAEVHLRDLPLRFASRGGYKLERALQRFGVDVTGRVCLDAGASTGGFTDCLLQHGAARVYAVEVGHGQFKGKLASDPRIVSLERTNISDVRRPDLDPTVEFAAADLSYLSLTKAVPILAGLFDGPLHAVCLVKPLYEGLDQGRKADPAALGAVLLALLRRLDADGFPACDVCVSPILGGRGAVEFLAWFRAGEGRPPEDATARAVFDMASDPPVDFAEHWRRDRDRTAGP